MAETPRGREKVTITNYLDGWIRSARSIGAVGRLLYTKPVAVLYMLEAGVHLAAASWQVHSYVFGRLAERLQLVQAESLPLSAMTGSREAIITARVQTAVHIMQKHAFGWQTKCLVRSLSAMRMLRTRGISSTLYLGTARDEQGYLIAHAWLRCGTKVVSGAEEMARFSRAGVFHCVARKEKRL